MKSPPWIINAGNRNQSHKIPNHLGWNLPIGIAWFEDEVMGRYNVGVNLRIVYFLVNHSLSSIAPSQLANLGLDRLKRLRGAIDESLGNTPKAQKANAYTKLGS